MILVEIEELLNVSQEDLGINSSYAISESDKTAFSKLEQKYQFGNFYSQQLFGAFQKYLEEQRRRSAGEDKRYLDTIECLELYGVSINSHMQLSNYRDKQFKRLLGEFPFKSLKQLDLAENARTKIAFANMGIAYDLAGDLFAARAVLLHAALKKYERADVGLQKTLSLSYDQIMNYLEENGFFLQEFAVGFVPNYSIRKAEKMLSLVRNDEQVRDFRDGIEILAEAVIRARKSIREDIVDFANATLDILINKKLEKEFLNPDEKEKVVEFLSRANGNFNRTGSKRRIVLNPSEKI